MMIIVFWIDVNRKFRYFAKLFVLRIKSYVKMNYNIAFFMVKSVAFESK